MSKKSKNNQKNTKIEEIQPLMVSDASFQEVRASSNGSTSMRRNAAGTITRTDRYKNIEDGLIPFR